MGLWLTNKLKTQQILTYLTDLSTDNLTNIVTTYFGPRFVNLYDTVGFNAKYLSFTDPSSIGTIDELYQEIEKALQNIQTNINHFDPRLVLVYNQINNPKLVQIATTIVAGVPYESDKRDLIQFIIKLLKD